MLKTKQTTSEEYYSFEKPSQRNKQSAIYKKVNEVSRKEDED